VTDLQYLLNSDNYYIINHGKYGWMWQIMYSYTQVTQKKAAITSNYTRSSANAEKPCEHTVSWYHVQV